MQRINTKPYFNTVKRANFNFGFLKDYKDEVFDAVFGVITSFSMVFANFIPFCLSFYASGDLKRTTVFKFIAILISSVISVGGAMSIKYIVPMLLYTALCIVVPIKKTSIKAGIISTLLFSTGLVATYFDGFLLYDIAISMVEAFVAFAGVFVMEKAIPIVKNPKSRNIISQDEFVCITALFAICAFAFSFIPDILGVNLCNVLCIVLIFVLAVNGELGMGASVGVIVGIVSGMNNFNLSATVGAFSFSALVSGLFKNYGRLGVCLGFVLANTVITIFLNSSSEVLISVYEILCAIAIFFVIPKNILNKTAIFLSAVSRGNEASTASAERFKEIVKTKIYASSFALSSLSEMFSSKSTKTDALDKNDLIAFFDSASKKVCSDCPQRYTCWQQNYKNTYSHMLAMFNLANLNGKILTKQLPDEFKDRCTRQDEFISSFNHMYEIFNLSALWKGKIIESKHIAASFLRDISKIINNTVDSTDLGIDIEVENDIKIALDKRSITANQVWALVADSKTDNFEITIKTSDTCDTNLMHEAVCEVLKRKVRVGKIENNKGDMLVKFYPAKKYNAFVCASSKTKDSEEISGDSFLSMPMNALGHLFAISDGMGSGIEAQNASRTTLTLLKRFFEAGIKSDDAINLINSTLLLKTDSEIFATLDLCTIDLDNLTARFIKIGSAVSYIKTKNKVERIEFSSLPIGILMNVEKKVCTKKLSEDSIIIMMSDGVYDAFQNENKLTDIIKNTDTKNGQEFADTIIESAISQGGCAKDDMTVLCIGINDLHKNV